MENNYSRVKFEWLIWVIFEKKLPKLKLCKQWLCRLLLHYVRNVLKTLYSFTKRWPILLDSFQSSFGTGTVVCKSQMVMCGLARRS